MKSSLNILHLSLVTLLLMACGEPSGLDDLEPDASSTARMDGSSPTELDAESVPFGSPMTVSAIVTLQNRPPGNTPVLSRWLLEGDERAWELGINRAQYPYFVASGDGTWSDEAIEVVGASQLRLGQPYLLSAVFQPDEKSVLYINTTEVARSENGVPPGIYESSADIAVGKRPGEDSARDSVGDVDDPVVEAAAWNRQQVANRAEALGLSGLPPTLPPIRQITDGPKFHWFGYYDKLQFDPSERYVLSNRVDFENRRPTADDVIKVGMIDVENGDEWIELGESTAWNWQQGCMLQWRPGSDTEVLWNDREDDRYVTRVLDVETRQMRTLPRPIHHVSPDGEFAIGSDFARWSDMRSGYSYVGISDPHADELAPSDSTLYRIDLDTGESDELFTLNEVAEYPYPHGDISRAKHYFSHIQIGPHGEKFNFFHRWKMVDEGGGGTRIFTANVDGSNLEPLAQGGGLSHITWLDPERIVVWTRDNGGYTLYEVGGEERENLLDFSNGHQTFLSDKRWMLTDTYPDRHRLQHPFLYDTETNEIFALGQFHSPREYSGAWRVDTHPRRSPNDNYVVIDSPHTGGRQLHLIDIRGIVQ